MKVRRWLIAAALVAGVVAVGVQARLQLTGRIGLLPGGVFLVEPYVQLGDAPEPSTAERAEVRWMGADREASWSVETQKAGSQSWEKAESISVRRVALDGIPPYRLGRAMLSGLVPGEEFAYRLRRDGAVVFGASARARRPAGRPHRFVAFGDCGADTSGERAVAYQTWRARPDFIMLTGDIAYTRGRLSEYLTKFFPILNSRDASPSSGAPLLQSTMVMPAPGNHDLILRDMDEFPDGLAYFYCWSVPLNGPATPPALKPDDAHGLRGSEAHRRAFLDAAGPAFPRMANYSFDYGDVHWTVLDANTYADLNDPGFQAWIERDLAAAKDKPWRFVALHHPPFHSSHAHAEDQRARVLAALFEKGNVSIVFCGHVHNYQRSYPLRFHPEKNIADPANLVRGRWTLDRAYDGRTRTTPEGIIYLVTGAGGARLYDTDQTNDAASWRDYTARFVSNVHSLTVVDVETDKLLLRQISEEGQELDRFVVTRPVAEPRGTMAPAHSAAPANGGL